MKMIHTNKALLVLVVLAVFVGAAMVSPPSSRANETRYVIDSAHVGAVRDIAFHAEGNLLVSVGEDGTIRVWDSRRRSLLHRVQASAIPIVSAALHPTEPRIALVTTDTISRFFLNVWDWETGQELFQVPIPDVPQYLAFSKGGSYLLYSRVDLRSMNVLDAQSGRQLSLLRDAFGIVSAFFMPEREHLLVAYLPSGRIQYLEPSTGAVRHEFETTPGITDIHFTSDERYLIGIRDNRVVAVDLVSGDEVARITVNGLRAIDVNPLTDEVLVFASPRGGEPGFRYYAFLNASFISRYATYRPLEDTAMTSFIIRNGNVYSGTPDGSLHVQPRYSSTPQVFAYNRLAAVHDFVPGASLLLTTSDRIITFYSDYLATGGSEQADDDILFFAQENPLLSPTRALPTPDGTYLLWDSSASRGRLAVYSPVFGVLARVDDAFNRRIVAVDVKGNELMTLDAAGFIRVMNLGDFSIRYERLEAVGLATAQFVGGAGIVAAGRKNALLNATMYHIDTRTYETVPIPGSAQYTLKTKYDRTTNTLYSIEQEGSRTSARTALSAHTGQTFEDRRVLFSEEGERHEFSMDTYGGLLFYSIDGKSYLRHPTTGRTIRVEDNNNIPVQLNITEDWLFARNRDSSITLWSRARGNKILDFYLFSDMEWVIITKAGGILTSEAGGSYVNAYPG